MEPSPAGQAQFATLTLPDGKTVQLPILEAHVGPPCLDVRALYSQTGYFTYDPGFTSTASCDVSQSVSCRRALAVPLSLYHTSISSILVYDKDTSLLTRTATILTEQL